MIKIRLIDASKLKKSQSLIKNEAVEALDQANRLSKIHQKLKEELKKTYNSETVDDLNSLSDEQKIELEQFKQSVKNDLSLSHQQKNKELIAQKNILKPKPQKKIASSKNKTGFI